MSNDHVREEVFDSGEYGNMIYTFIIYFACK